MLWLISSVKVTPDTLKDARGISTIIPVVIPKGSLRRHVAYVPGRHPSIYEELWVFLMEDDEVRGSFSIPQLSRNTGNPVPPRVGPFE